MAAISCRAESLIKTSQSDDGWQKSTTRSDELGEKDANAVRGIVNFNFTETLQVQVIAHYVKDESENKANTSYDGTTEGLGTFNNPYTRWISTSSHWQSLGETPPWYSKNDNEAADWTNSYTSPITGRTFNLRPQRDNELKGASAQGGLGYRGPAVDLGYQLQRFRARRKPTTGMVASSTTPAISIPLISTCSPRS